MTSDGLFQIYSFLALLFGEALSLGLFRSYDGQLASWCFCSLKSEPLADGVRRRWATMTCCNLFQGVWRWPCEGSGSLVSWLRSVVGCRSYFSLYRHAGQYRRGCEVGAAGSFGRL
uniref:Uncharacterized protein n=1 Tax=Oryza brachyantha TaxID=4533 RepID=J3LLX0_ORYBR